MNGFSKYVLKQLLVGMVLVTATLTCVIWLIQSLRFLEYIVEKSISAGMFIYFTMLLLPNFLALILPFATFAVVVFTYNKMIVDRELVVMRSVGLSQMALAKPALLMAGLVIVIAYSLNVHFLPESYRLFRELQWDFRYNHAHVLLREGTFNTITPDITVYVRERTDDGQIHGILAHDSRDKQRPVTLMAERGALIETKSGGRVVMFNGNRQEVDVSTHQLSILYFDRFPFEFERDENQGAVRYREPRERRIGDLFNIEKDPNAPKHDYGKFTVEGHKRRTSPLSILSLTMIALACLIRGSFSRRMQTRRIVIAVGLMVLVQGTTMGLENLAARKLDLVPLLYVNAILPALLAYFFLVKHPRRRVSEPDDAPVPAT